MPLALAATVNVNHLHDFLSINNCCHIQWGSFHLFEMSIDPTVQQVPIHIIYIYTVNTMIHYSSIYTIYNTCLNKLHDMARGPCRLSQSKLGSYVTQISWKRKIVRLLFHNNFDDEIFYSHHSSSHTLRCRAPISYGSLTSANDGIVKENIGNDAHKHQHTKQ